MIAYRIDSNSIEINELWLNSSTPLIGKISQNQIDAVVLEINQQKGRCHAGIWVIRYFTGERIGDP